jgi:hypothetical protein
VHFGKNAIRVVTLATLACGIGWLFSVQGSRDSMDKDPGLAVEIAKEPTVIRFHATRDARDLIENSSDRDAANAVGVAPAEGSTGATLESLEKESGDPTIARGAKAVIQRALDKTLDRTRYQVPAVICNEQNCQIFSNPQVPGSDTDWPSIVEAIMQDLATASFRSAETGAELRPALKAISRSRGKDAATVTIIWLR